MNTVNNSKDNAPMIEPSFEIEIGRSDWIEDYVLGLLDHDPGVPDTLVVSPLIDRDTYSQVCLELLGQHFRLQFSPAQVRAERQCIYIVFSGFEALAKMDIAAMGIKAEIVSVWYDLRS